MRTSRPLWLIALLFLVSWAWSPDVLAKGESCSVCGITCQNYCAVMGEICTSYWTGCGNDCGTQSGCVIVCGSDSPVASPCDCPACGGGSPIFRKRPTNPPPTGAVCSEPDAPATAATAAPIRAPVPSPAQVPASLSCP